MLSKIGMVLFVAAVFNRAVRSAEEADVDSPVEESKKNFKFETITEYLTHINQLQDHLYEMKSGGQLEVSVLSSIVNSRQSSLMNEMLEKALADNESVNEDYQRHIVEALKRFPWSFLSGHEGLIKNRTEFYEKFKIPSEVQMTEVGKDLGQADKEPDSQRKAASSEEDSGATADSRKDTPADGEKAPGSTSEGVESANVDGTSAQKGAI